MALTVTPRPVSLAAGDPCRLCTHIILYIAESLLWGVALYIMYYYYYHYYYVLGTCSAIVPTVGCD